MKFINYTSGNFSNVIKYDSDMIDVAMEKRSFLNAKEEKKYLKIIEKGKKNLLEESISEKNRGIIKLKSNLFNVRDKIYGISYDILKEINYKKRGELIRNLIQYDDIFKDGITKFNDATIFKLLLSNNKKTAKKTNDYVSFFNNIFSRKIPILLSEIFQKNRKIPLNTPPYILYEPLLQLGKLYNTITRYNGELAIRYILTLDT